MWIARRRKATAARSRAVCPKLKHGSRDAHIARCDSVGGGASRTCGQPCALKHHCVKRCSRAPAGSCMCEWPLHQLSRLERGPRISLHDEPAAADLKVLPWERIEYRELCAAGCGRAAKPNSLLVKECAPRLAEQCNPQHCVRALPRRLPFLGRSARGTPWHRSAHWRGCSKPTGCFAREALVRQSLARGGSDASYAVSGV